jgi:hypothetical protein
MSSSDFPHPDVPYRANRFALRLYDDWQDATVFTITGPAIDGVQHNIIVNAEPDTPYDSLRSYAEYYLQAMESELKGCRMLMKGDLRLSNGMPAFRAVFSWYPTDELRVYMEQIYVLHEKTAFRLTATFTKKTRKTIGPAVERMMLSFVPQTFSSSPKP